MYQRASRLRGSRYRFAGLLRGVCISVRDVTNVCKRIFDICWVENVESYTSE